MTPEAAPRRSVISPTDRRRAGAVTVVALLDAEGPFFQARGQAFPGATAEHWRRADALDPGALRAGGWWLSFRCYALRLPDGGVILVDAGIGPAAAPAKSWAPVPGRLPHLLAAAGITPAQVHTVVLTHLHSDHIGWAVDGRTGRPYFPHARYLLQQAEIETILQHDPGLAAWLLEPLQASRQLSGVDGAVTLTSGLRLVPTPGHTPGHQSVLLDSGNGTLLFTGDLLVHAVQLVDPELAYAHETDPEAARASRMRLLRELAARDGTTLATPHLSEPFLPAGLAHA
jgi:glyoxylase-like metal-dependent hydrolase (beta-lactamase superfamily II)